MRRFEHVWKNGRFPVSRVGNVLSVAGIGLGALLVFAADMAMRTKAPGGGAVPVVYLGLVFLSFWLPWRWAPLGVAVVGGGLTLAAPLWSDEGIIPVEGVNRLLLALVIGAGGLVVYRVRRMRRALAEAEAEAGRANRSKSRFLAAAGHDLRHPIQAGLLFHDLLSRRLRGTPHAELVDNLGLSLVAMRTMLDDLLEISRLESGRIEAHKRDVPIISVFGPLADRFAPIAVSSGVTFRVVHSAAVIRSDPALLSLLCESLLSNAIRFTRDGRVLLGCRRRGRRLAIQVWDTGIGIPNEHLDAIFEEFQQLRAVGGGAGEGGGHGLGLSRARRLGRVLDHPIRVRSVVGRGSVFEVWVPLAISP